MKANLAWINFVNETVSAQHIPFADAWEHANRTKPDLNILMRALGATAAAVKNFNSERGRKIGAGARIEARKQFANEVQNYSNKFNVGYDAAYAACSRQNPDLFQAMSQTTASFENVGDGTFKPVALVTNNRQLLLPDSTSQTVFDVAWEANGHFLTPAHPGKICDALVQYFIKEKSLSHDAALDYVKSNFPALWRAVKELAGK